MASKQAKTSREGTTKKLVSKAVDYVVGTASSNKLVPKDENKVLLSGYTIYMSNEPNVATFFFNDSNDTQALLQLVTQHSKNFDSAEYELNVHNGFTVANIAGIAMYAKSMDRAHTVDVKHDGAKELLAKINKHLDTDFFDLDKKEADFFKILKYEAVEDEHSDDD